MKKWIVRAYIMPYKSLYSEAAYIEGSYADASQEGHWLCENIVTNYDMWYELTDNDNGKFEDLKDYRCIEIYPLPDNFDIDNSPIDPNDYAHQLFDIDLKF